MLCACNKDLKLSDKANIKFCSILVSLRHPLSTQTSCEELSQNIEQLCFLMKTATFLFIFCVWLLLHWVKLVLSPPLPNKILPKVIFWYFGYRALFEIRIFDSLTESQDKYHCATKKPILVLCCSQMLTVYFRFHTFSLYIYKEFILMCPLVNQNCLLYVQFILPPPPLPTRHRLALYKIDILLRWSDIFPDEL